MRGDPPLIGCACCAGWGLSANRRPGGKAVARCPAATCRYNPAHRRPPRPCRHRHPTDSASVTPRPTAPGGPRHRGGHCVVSDSSRSPALADAGGGAGADRPRSPGSCFLLSRARRRNHRIRCRPRPPFCRRKEIAAQIRACRFRGAGDGRDRQRQSAHRRRRPVPAASPHRDGRGRCARDDRPNRPRARRRPTCCGRPESCPPNRC